MFEEKNIFITGGTGSFGQSFLHYIFTKNIVFKSITLFSRDELKHYNLQQKYPKKQYPMLRFVIGDIRDVDRVEEATKGMDIVIHAAAMKHVYLCEDNPTECYKTNVEGTKNLIKVAEESKTISQVIAISTDKAVNPNNVYGNSKKEAEMLFLNANSDAKKVTVVRYPNVKGASGSVIPTFLKQKETGVLKLTDKRMTRYFISPEKAVETVIYALENQNGGKIIIPKCKEENLVDIAKEICPECTIEFVGIRPGEKLNEELLTIEEKENSTQNDNYFFIFAKLINTKS